MTALLALIPKKALYAVVTGLVSAAIAAAKAKWPSVPWPSPEAILALGGGVVGAHTVTDVVHLLTNRGASKTETRGAARN